MNRPVEDAVREWLQADAAGQGEAGDRALRDVAAAWPRRMPPPGLAARIAVALAGQGRRAAVRTVPAPWVRATVAAALAGCGGLLGLTPGRELGGLLWSAFQGTVAGVGGVLALGSFVGDTMWAILEPAARAGRAVGVVVAGPVPAAVLAVNVLVAAGAFVALRRVLVTREV